MYIHTKIYTYIHIYTYAYICILKYGLGCDLAWLVRAVRYAIVVPRLLLFGVEALLVAAERLGAGCPDL